MNDRNTEQQLRYLEEVCTYLHRAGFEAQPLEDSQLPVYWNGAQLCRITGKGSVFYRREDVSTPQAEEALIRAEDITVRTLEYMTAMETAPQLKASGLEGDYRILADFNGTVLAGSHSKYGVHSLHGTGTMTARACPTDTTSWKTMTEPSKILPYEAASSTRSSFSARSR